MSFNLTYKNQVSNAVNKANNMIGLLKRTFTHRGSLIWKRLYTTYVRPQPRDVSMESIFKTRC